MDMSKLSRLVAVVVGALLGAALLWWVLSSNTAGDPWALAKVAAAVLMAIGTVFLLRLALRGVDDTRPTDQDGVRNRIAPLVIGIGAAGILALSIVVMLLVYNNADDNNRTVVMSVFTAVLPVFATWVGTVLAFYFSSESYRQAAQVARQQIGDLSDEEAITSRMFPYDKVTKLVLGKDNTPADPKGIPMASVRKLFGDTITRVIIFDGEGRPVYIVRRSLDVPDDAVTVADYLGKDERLADATNFRFLPGNANVGDGRRALKLHGTKDLFVTDRGGPNESVRGWVPDDRLA